MIKSRFMEKQPSVKVIEKDKVYVFICLNEAEVTEENMNGDMSNEEPSEPVTMYEYDYNEIIEDVGVLDIDDIKTNPEDYLNYKKNIPKTDSERIAELEAINLELSTTMDSLLTEFLPSLLE